MSKSRMCKDIVEAIARNNPGCPLLRHCSMFSHSCQFPNRIELDKVTDEDKLCSACEDPEGTYRECYCEVINQGKVKSDGKRKRKQQ